MIDKNRALLLLGSGLGPTDVASTLGCDPSYISQLLMDDEFRAQVLSERIKSLTANTARDKKIDGIEDELIMKLQDNIKWMTKSRDILQAFQILNNAKRRGAGSVGSNITVNQQIVSINLPPVARQHFFPKMNAAGEVVQVGEQVTVTKSLQQLLAERAANQISAPVQDAEVLNENSRSTERSKRSTEGASA